MNDELKMKNFRKIFLIAGALFGFTGVALGAFGAHGLRTVVSSDIMAAFETGVRYQMYHMFALFAAALLFDRADAKKLRAAGISFIAGIILFSGSLYAMTFTGIRIFGAITPFGGIGFLSGWIFLLLAVIKIKKEN